MIFTTYNNKQASDTECCNCRYVDIFTKNQRGEYKCLITNCFQPKEIMGVSICCSGFVEQIKEWDS